MLIGLKLIPILESFEAMHGTVKTREGGAAELRVLGMLECVV